MQIETVFFSINSEWRVVIGPLPRYRSFWFEKCDKIRRLYSSCLDRVSTTKRKWNSILLCRFLCPSSPSALGQVYPWNRYRLYRWWSWSTLPMSVSVTQWTWILSWLFVGNSNAFLWRDAFIIVTVKFWSLWGEHILINGLFWFSTCLSDIVFDVGRAVFH